VCREGRELLAEELGIDPSPALQQLEADILRQAAHLAASDPATRQGSDHAPASGSAGGVPTDRARHAASPPATAPRPRNAFVGRDAEMALLEEVLDGARSGAGQLVLLSGEPGIGKSRLIQELGRHAAPLRPVVGRCVQAEGVPPFWPWVQVLGALPQTPSGGDKPVALAQGDELGSAVAARFSQALQVAARIRAAAGSHGSIVVLEDVHWADPASLELLHLVTAELITDPVLVVASYRDVEIASGAALEATLGLLARHPAVTHLRLSGLDEAAVEALVGQTAGVGPAAQDPAALLERTGGNPYFITELLRWSSVSAGSAGAGGDGGRRGEGPLPTGVRDVLRLRLAALPPAAVHGLTVGAVVGRDFPLHLLEAAVDEDPEMLLESIEAALAAGLLTEPAPGRFRFAHALVREVLLDSSSAARRARVHGRLLAALRQRHGVHAPVAALAHHAHAAALGGVDVADAAELCLRSAQEALTRIAYEDAVAAAGRGLELDDTTPLDPAVRCDLLLVRAEALKRLGDLSGAGDAIDVAYALAREHEDAARITQAALASAGGGFGLFWSLAWTAEPAIDVILERLIEANAVAPETDAQTQVAVASLLASTLTVRGRPREADEVSAAALERGRELGGLSLARALRGRLVARWYGDAPEERILLAEELITVAGNHRQAELTGRFFRMHALLELGDVAASDAELARFEQRARELRMVEHELAAGWFRADRALMEGRLVDAEQLAEQLAAPRPGTTDAARLVLSSAIASVRGIGMWFRGRLHEMGINAEQVPADAHPGWRLIAAMSLAETGDTAGAATLLAEAMPLDAPGDLEGVDAVANAWLRAEVAVLVGDVARARLLHAQLLPLAGRLVVFSPDATCHGSAELPLGSLAAVCGDLDEAVDRLERAIDVNDRVGARPYSAIAHARLAGVLRARGGAEDVTAAGLNDTSAQRIAEELELPGVGRPWRVSSSTTERSA
jgi:tetratricopeptide (TPR) repeat protein